MEITDEKLRQIILEEAMKLVQETATLKEEVIKRAHKRIRSENGEKTK